MYSQNAEYVIKDNHVVVENVFPFSTTKMLASAAVNSFFVTNLNDSNISLKNSSDDYYVAKFITDVHYYTLAKVAAKITAEVRLKEDRMKITISCDNLINHYGAGHQSEYSPLDAAPLAEKHEAWRLNIFKKDAEGAFKNLVTYMNLLMNNINSAVQNAKAEDDW